MDSIPIASTANFASFPATATNTTISAFLPKWGRNMLRIIIIVGGTAIILSMLWEEQVRGPGAISLLPWSKSTTNNNRNKQQYTGNDGGGFVAGAGGGGASIWDDSMMYTPEGMSHDAYKLMAREGLAPFTEEVQSYIYQHQFPESCDGRKFLISNGNDGSAGLGSHLHIMGMHLGLAIELDRIFVMGAQVGGGFTDDETCEGRTNFECFFRPASSCTLTDAMKEGADTIEANYGTAGSEYKIKYWFTPTPFRAMWDQAQIPIKFHEMKYWWRGQSVGFLARFRDEAVRIMKKLRTEPSSVLNYPTNEEWGNKLAHTFPFERGMTSIHVRHGDKAIEMQLVNDEKYFEAAEAMVVNNPLRHIRAAYISTEDPAVIETAQHRNVSHDWRYLWFDVPRINSNGADQLAKVGMAKGLLTHVWWLQLLMALECDSWVGTRGSNWNRLIDELRCVWVPKCYNEYAEVGSYEDYKDYSW